MFDIVYTYIHTRYITRIIDILHNIYKAQIVIYALYLNTCIEPVTGFRDILAWRFFHPVGRLKSMYRVKNIKYALKHT